MVQEMTADKKKKTNLYKVQSDEHRANMLSELVGRSALQLAEAHENGKISLSDTEAIKLQTMKYLKACETAGAFPSIVGLSRALGYSRRAIYNEIERRSCPATADWLELFRDTCADVLIESALTNNCNAIVSIFLMKSLHEFRESVEIIARPASDPLGSGGDLAAMARKYQNMLPETTISTETEDE